MKIVPRTIRSDVMPDAALAACPVWRCRDARARDAVAESTRRGGQSKPSLTCPVVALAKASVSANASEQRALAAFARRAGIDQAELARVMAKAPGDRLETGKMYAVLADAVHGKVSSERAGTMRAVVEAMREGRLYVVKSELTRSRAAYNHETNTVLVPLEGISLSAEADRVAIVHEAEHVAQDLRMARQTRYESESEAHEAAADYLLHLGGALSEHEGETQIDVVRANAVIATLQARAYEPVDIISASRLCRRLAEETARRGGPIDLDTARNVFGDESFAEAYDRAHDGTGNAVRAFDTAMAKKGL